MNYDEFKEFRRQVDPNALKLDSLNPYKDHALLPFNFGVEVEQSQTSVGYYVKYSSGVRGLLRDLLSYFSNLGYQLAIPEDVYPEYFRLAPRTATIKKYASCNKTHFVCSRKSACLFLIANPLIPEGRYLSVDELRQVDRWLSKDDGRWVVFDNVYDYDSQAFGFKFKSKQVIFLNSLSKVNLKPNVSGWAFCKTKLPGFSDSDVMMFNDALAREIENYYARAWKRIEQNTKMKLISNWKPPKVGYLSVVQKKYDKLLEQFNIAAIPGSVFGIRDENLSVISCLSEVNKNVY